MLTRKGEIAPDPQPRDEKSVLLSGMTLGSPSRTPPRRRFAQRIASAFCIALLSLPLAAGRAEAYPCGSATGGRVISADCPAPAPAKPKPAARPGEPNLLSVAIFVVALVGVLVIPINYSRRRLDE